MMKIQNSTGLQWNANYNPQNITLFLECQQKPHKTKASFWTPEETQKF